MTEQGRNETFPRIERIGDTVFIHVRTQLPDDGLIDPTEIAAMFADGMGTQLRLRGADMTHIQHSLEVFLKVFREAMRMAATKSPRGGEIEGE